MNSVASNICVLFKGDFLNTRNIVSKMTSIMKHKCYNTLAITEPSPSVIHVQLNRADKLNALNNTMWLEIGECFNELSNKSDCRAIILSGSGKIFCAGIDLMDATKLFQDLSNESDIARKCKVLENKIKQYQNSFTAIEKCKKPVIAAIHGACIGGGLDMICSADMRYCSADAWFQIKEVDLGMTADVGTLQRLPKIIGSEGLVKELAYTGRKMLAPESLQIGFVNQILSNQDSLMSRVLEVAKLIASKSPVAVQGTKLSLNYSRDHSVEEGLNHILMRNQVMLQSEDFINAATALATKSGSLPIFSKL